MPIELTVQPPALSDPLVIELRREAVRAFSLAIGETRPEYTDVDAARRAGHADLLMPPTYLFAVEFLQDHPLRYLEQLGADLRLILHGEQSFAQHMPLHAGDVLTGTRYVESVTPKGPMMHAVVKRSIFARGGETVAECTTTVLARTSVPVR